MGREVNCCKQYDRCAKSSCSNTWLIENFIKHLTNGGKLIAIDWISNSIQPLCTQLITADKGGTCAPLPKRWSHRRLILVVDNHSEPMLCMSYWEFLRMDGDQVFGKGNCRCS